MARPMKLVNLLKKSLETQDWDLVKKAIKQVESETKEKTATVLTLDKKIKKDKKKSAELAKAFKNGFVDDLTIAPEDINDSKKLSKKIPKKEYRAPYKESVIICSECNQSSVLPINLIRKYNAEDAPSFKCDNCLKGKFNASN